MVGREAHARTHIPQGDLPKQKMAGLSANSNLEGGNQPSYKENPIAILKISWCRTKKKQKTEK